MATAKLTLIGLYNHDNTLFDNLQVPTGVDRDEVIDNILLKGGEFEVLFPDFDFLKGAIGIWSKKWQRTMQRWYDALSIDYNPLENYDRMEDWLDSNNRNNQTKRLENAIGSDISESTGSGNTTATRSAFDATDYQPHDKADSSSTGNNTSSSSTSAYGTTEDNETTLNKRIGRAHGNIGVTTSQQMLESELEISKWNLYDEIADLFISELCIYLY